MKFSSINITKNDSNTAQTFWVGIGSLSSFLFSLLSSVILSHFLPKAEYGTYQQVLYVYTTLLTVFTLGLPRAFSYFLPRISKAQAKDSVWKINHILMLIGIIFSVALFLTAPFIGRVLGNDDLSCALKWFSPVPLFILPTMGMEGIYATYRKTYISAMYLVLTRIFILACVALPVMIFKGSYLDAVKGFVAASFLQFILAMLLEVRFFRDVKREKSEITFKEIAHFAIPLTIANLWGWVISSADQFFISRYFGQNVFAEYSNGAIKLPFVAMIIGATTTVLVPLLSKKLHQKEDFRQTMLPIIRNVFAKTAMLSYPLIFFFWFFAPEIINFLYGEMYAASSLYFRIVLISNLFMLITTGSVIIAMGANRFFARVHMYGAIILIAAEYTCVTLFHSPYAVITASVVCFIGRIVIMFLFIMRSFNIPLRDFVPWRLLLDLSVPSVAILMAIKYVLGYFDGLSSIVLIIIGIGAYGVLFLLWAIFRKIDYLSIIKPFFTKNPTKQNVHNE